MTMLSVESLTAWYGQARALEQVTLEVPQNSVIGLLGHNGAGKSTLLRAIAGLHRHVDGAIRYAGHDIRHTKAHDVSRAGLVLVREGAKVFDTLTVQEHLALGERLRRAARHDQLTTPPIMELFPALQTRLNVRAGLLSGGQRQMLALATALASAPSCVLLDEPSTGLAAVIVEEFYSAVGALSQNGVTFLVAEQNPTWVAQFASHSYLLESGRIIARGAPKAWIPTDGLESAREAEG